MKLVNSKEKGAGLSNLSPNPQNLSPISSRVLCFILEAHLQSHILGSSSLKFRVPRTQRSTVTNPVMAHKVPSVLVFSSSNKEDPIRPAATGSTLEIQHRILPPSSPGASHQHHLNCLGHYCRDTASTTISAAPDAAAATHSNPKGPTTDPTVHQALKISTH